MLMCEYCQQEVKSHGEKIFVGYRKMTFEESMETDTPCEWCDEYDDLYEVRFID